MIEIKLEVIKVTLLIGLGPDKVSLHTTYSSPFPKVTNQSLFLDFSTEKGTGRVYLIEVLGIDESIIEVIDLTS